MPKNYHRYAELLGKKSKNHQNKKLPEVCRQSAGLENIVPNYQKVSIQ